MMEELPLHGIYNLTLLAAAGHKKMNCYIQINE
jgi:hypothetical protein